MASRRTLIFVPTFNERENAEPMGRALAALGLDADILFCDDGSPDGTGDALDRLAAELPRLSVLHRAGKLGIGSAHLDGIARAYDLGYDTLLTMDCDFTHSPQDVPRLLEAARSADVAVGSRYLRSGSLPGWNPLRRSLTAFGHLLTRTMLGMPQDATGAFRVYDLRRVPRRLFGLVSARGYAFFFESLFILRANGFSIAEIPITLPARTYGHSKMSFREAARSAKRVVRLGLAKAVDPARFRIGAEPVGVDPSLVDPQGWDAYWQEKRRASGLVYEVIAAVYRKAFIRRALQRVIRRRFPAGASLLHAGCGGGQVDANLSREMRITAVDISVPALELYGGNNPAAAEVCHASIFRLPHPDGSFDGAYNLGVMEHFTPDEIARILRELARVVRPGGEVVLFWPHRFASSVLVLKTAHFVLNRVLRRGVSLHPPELTLMRSRRFGFELLRAGGLEPVSYRFGPGDLFVHAVLVGRAGARSAGGAP